MIKYSSASNMLHDWFFIALVSHCPLVFHDTEDSESQENEGEKSEMVGTFLQRGQVKLMMTRSDTVKRYKISLHTSE